MTTGRRALWIISILVVAILASLVGVYFAWIAAANRRIEAEKPILKRRTEELRAKRVLRPAYFEPEEEGNGWPLLVRAVEGIAAVPKSELEAFPNVSDEDDAKLKPEEAERLLTKIAPHLEDLKGALRRRWTEHDYAYEDHLRMKELNLGDVIKVARVLAGAATMRHDAGRSEEAVDFLMLGLGLGDRVTAKGNLIHHLVSVVVKLITRTAVSEALEAGHQFDEASLKRLERVFEWAASSRPVLMEALRIEDLRGRHLAVDFATRGGAAIDGLGGRDGLSDSRSVDWIAAKYLEVQDEFMAEVERLARLPFPENQEPMKALVQKTSEAASPLHRLLVPQIARAFFVDRSMEIEFALMRPGLAVARYRKKHPDWPKAWKDLVPDYLPEIPTDPVGSHPLGLTFKDGAAVIYSWGGDGKDDGGDPAPDNDLDLPGDMVLRVKKAK